MATRRANSSPYHADFRYVVRVAEGAVKLQSEEVTDWRWIDLAYFGNPHLAERLGPCRPGER
jgi:hypothetical protein